MCLTNRDSCRYAIDCEKVKQLGWMQKIPFDVGLERTIKWYKEKADTHWSVEGVERAIMGLEEEPNVTDAEQEMVKVEAEEEEEHSDEGVVCEKRVADAD